MKPIRYLAALLLLATCLPQAAFAAPITIVPSPPDMSFGFVSVNYAAATETLTVTGYATNFRDGSGVDHGTSDGLNATLSMTAIINHSGVLQSGSLSIDGDIPTLSLSGNLLTADITQFGDVNPSDLDTFYFLGATTAGLLAGGQYGAEMGVILNGTGAGQPGGFANDWTSDWGQSLEGTADVTTPAGASVPIVAAWPLMAIGLFGMAMVRRGRQD